MIAYLVKVIVIQAVALAAYYLLLHREPLGHLKRAYLLLAPVAAFFLPLCAVTYVLPDPAGILPMGEVQAHAFIATEAPAGDWLPTASLLIYGIGLILAIVRLLRPLLYLRRQLLRATHITESDGAYWVTLPGPTAVHTFGRYIFHPASMPLTAAIREHELVHVREWHTADRLFIAVLRTVCWFNPILYGYERTIVHNHELLADRQALSRTGLPVSTYQRSLLQSLAPPVALASGLPFSFTKQRFTMLTASPPSPRRTAAKGLVLASLWVFLLIGFGKTAVAQSTDTIIPPPPPTAPAPPPNAPPPPPNAPTLLPPPPPLAFPPPPPGWTGSNDVEHMDPKTRLRFSLAIHQAQPESAVTAGDLSEWQNPREYDVWLDGQPLANDKVANLNPADIYGFTKSKLMKNAKDYGKYTYYLSLTTRAAYDAQTKRLKGEIAALE